MVKLVNCPICKREDCVMVRKSDGNVIAFACTICGKVFKSEWSWDESLQSVIYWGLELNPEFTSKSSDFSVSLLEILELEKKGIPKYLGKYKMFDEKVDED